MLGGDRDADLDAASGDSHLLADRGDGGGHLHLLGVRRHPGEGAAAGDTGRHVLQVAQRRRGPAAGNRGGFLPGGHTGRADDDAAVDEFIGATICAEAENNPTEPVKRRGEGEAERDRDPLDGSPSRSLVEGDQLVEELGNVRGTRGLSDDVRAGGQNTAGTTHHPLCPSTEPAHGQSPTVSTVAGKQDHAPTAPVPGEP